MQEESDICISLKNNIGMQMGRFHCLESDCKSAHNGMCIQYSAPFRACPGRGPRHSHDGVEPLFWGCQWQMRALLFTPGLGGADAAGVAEASSRWRPLRMTAWCTEEIIWGMAGMAILVSCLRDNQVLTDQLTAISNPGLAQSSCAANTQDNISFSSLPSAIMSTQGVAAQLKNKTTYPKPNVGQSLDTVLSGRALTALSCS